MAGRKENLKALFTNTRSRVIIVFTAILLITAVIIGIAKFKFSTEGGPSGTSRVSVSPTGIQSIPGSADPTAQYAKLQEEQNVNQAQRALKSGGSAIPTIIRTQELGSGAQPVGVSTGGEGGVGFATLAREDEGGAQRSLWVQALQNSSCSKAAVNKVVSEGAVLTDLKVACNCIQLKDNGYQLTDLEQICSCNELKAAGFNAQQLKTANFSANRLRLCGFNACELQAAGFSAQQMKDGGFTDGELKGAGYTAAEIAKAGGLPGGISEKDISNAGCQPEALKRLHASGVTASAVRRISGCNADQLKAAGYGAEDLRNAGFTAADLKNAGFTPAELKQADYTARDLLNAGFTPDDLTAAGFKPGEIVAAEAELPPGISPADIKTAGCDIEAIRKERIAGVSAKLISQYAGCSVQALKAAGFSDSDLANAGFTPAQIAAGGPVSNDAIRAAGCNADKLKVLLAQGVTAKRIHDLNGCDAATLKTAGYSPEALKGAGFSDADLANAGFTPAEIASGTMDDKTVRAAGCDPNNLKTLLAQGVSAKRIHDLNGCDAAALKATGYSAADLKNAGFSDTDLAKAGFTPAQIAEAAADENTIHAVGCDPEKLKVLLTKGVSAKRIHDLNGCDATALKAAGYDAKALSNAGFTPEQLLAAGFTPQQLSQAGVGAAAAIAAGRTAGCSVASLQAARLAGVSAATIKQTLGCNAAALKAAGFTAADLRAGGFTAAELKNAGFSAADLKNAGFSAKELHDAGFSAADLKNVGFSAADLKDANFSAIDLKAAGFSADQLKAAGYSAKDLKNAGFSAAALRQAGYSASDMKDAGFSAAQLKNAGYSDSDLQSAGITSAVAGLGNVQQPSISQSNIATIPGMGPSSTAAATREAANAKQLQEILKRQNQQLADQKFQQQIQQRTNAMLTNANQHMNNWQKVTTQVYIAGNEHEKEKASPGAQAESQMAAVPAASQGFGPNPPQKALIKTGDILFAVIDTSVNSDEPGPVLATIISGKLKGAKLIGSFTLPTNAEKMVINFNTLSVPGAAKTTSINAYAIDANTARTALASSTDHHYLLRYGSLFAASFLQGFGNAFQSANTTVTIGGTGGGDNISVQNGVNRSILENAVIGLATVGKNWGQVAQQQFNTPTTVEVYSGTSIGVLFTQDLTSLS